MFIEFKNDKIGFHGLIPGQYKSDIIDGNDPRFVQADDDRDKTTSGRFAWTTTKATGLFLNSWNMPTTFCRQKVRQAMSHAFPKQRVIDDVFMASVVPKPDQYNVTAADYNTELLKKDFTFDLEKAKSYSLKPAGPIPTRMAGSTKKLTASKPTFVLLCAT